MRLKIEEKQEKYDVWSSVIDIEIEKEGDKQRLKFAKKYFKDYTVLQDGKATEDTIDDLVKKVVEVTKVESVS
jgi:uncharacterized FAD-dependent dehydrogenase